MNIIKGHLIPKWDGNKFCNADIIENELQIFEDFIIEVINLIKNELVKEIKTGNDLKKFNDAFMFLVEGCLSKMRRQVASFMLSYIFLKDPIAFEEFFDRNEELAKKFLTIPSDTRPILNTSSLWVHLKTTSALAVSNYLNATAKEGFNQENLEKLRFACFFHDLGKPYERESHVSATIPKLKEIFENYISPPIFNEIMNGIKHHHDSIPPDYPNRELYNHLRLADRSSSNYDRATKIAMEILPKIDQNFSWVKDQTKFNDWSEWKKHADKLLEITKDSVELFRKKYVPDELKSYEKTDKHEGAISLIIGDARQIKGFVDKSRKLKEIKGGAIIIDEALTVGYEDESKKQLIGVIYALWNNQIPPENLIFYGGGNIVLFGPAANSQKLQKVMKESFGNATKQGAIMTTADQLFDLVDFVFGGFYSELLGKLAEVKSDLCLEPEAKIIQGYKKVCSSCNKRIANLTIQEYGEASEDICDSCMQKRDKSYNILYGKSFANIWQNQKLTLKWDIIKNNIPEFIAGWSQKDVEDADSGKRKQAMSLGIIKADGNEMGKFFGNSLTISQLVEKSILTDIAMDTCIQEVLDLVEKSYDREDIHSNEMVARINLGQIYRGGDDLLLFLPGWISVPAALILMRKRRLKYDATREEGSKEIWRLRIVGDKSSDNRVEVINPHLDEEQVEKLSSQIGQILHTDV